MAQTVVGDDALVHPFEEIVAAVNVADGVMDIHEPLMRQRGDQSLAWRFW
jgi:hypothetical protein